MTRLSGEGLDFDRAFSDFGHFAFEKALDHFRVAAAENDFYSAGRVAHFQDQRLHALAGVVHFTGDLLAARHDSFDPAECRDQCTAFKPGDRSGNDRADTVFVFLVDAAPLGGTDQLDHDLFDRLSADAADQFDVERHTAAGGRKIAGGTVQLHVKFVYFFRVEMLA